jgi:ABC-type lipoprotein release transport system permease subunit
MKKRATVKTKEKKLGFVALFDDEMKQVNVKVILGNNINLSLGTKTTAKIDLMMNTENGKPAGRIYEVVLREIKK